MQNYFEVQTIRVYAYCIVVYDGFHVFIEGIEV